MVGNPGTVTVVIPTFEERESIERVIRGVLDHGYRAVVVDDGSADGTGDIVEKLGEAFDGVTLIQRGSKQGLGSAYAAGFRAAVAAGAAIVVQMDADLSHDPARLPDLVGAVETGADLAVGSRFVAGGAIVHWSRLRRFLSRSGNWYARHGMRLPVHDATSGFKAFRSEGLDTIDAASCRSNGYAFQIEMTWRAHHHGLRITEIPIRFVEREAGNSKLTGRIVAEAMWLVTRWSVATRLRRDPAI